MSRDELFRRFEALVSLAIVRREEIVETTDEVINFFNPAGLGGASYFIYKGIKVCREGLTDTLSKELNIAHYKKSGLNYAKIEGSHSG